MPKIKVNTGNMTQSKEELQSIIARIKTIKTQFSTTSRNLDWDIKSASNINSKMSNVERELSNQLSGISNMKNFLEMAAKIYDEVENENSFQNSENHTFATGFKMDVQKEIFMAQRLINFAKSHGYLNSWRDMDPLFKNPNYIPWIKGIYKKIDTGIQQGISVPVLKPAFINYLSSFVQDEISTLGKKALNSLSDTKKNYGKYSYEEDIIEQKKIPIKKINPDKWYEQRGTIFEINKNKKYKIMGEKNNLLDPKYELKYGDTNFKMSGNLDVYTKNIDGNANFEAGLYAFKKDKNGKDKKIFSPKVAAEVGASAALFEIVANSKVGIGKNKDILGASAEASAKVASAEAKAGVKINSKEARAGFKAEANLFEMKGQAGVSVLGTGIGVNGSLKAGLGINADVGFTDGKFKVDVGAAIGVGASVGFEIDVSGTVNAVTGIAQSIWDKWN